MNNESILLKVTCPTQWADLISCTLVESGSAGVEERDAGTMTASVDNAVVEIIAGFDSDEIRARAASAVRDLPIRSDKIRVENIDHLDDDWKTKWREFFEPQVVRGLGGVLDAHLPTMMIEVIHDDVGIALETLLAGKPYLYFLLDEQRGPVRKDTVRKGSKLSKDYLFCTEAVARQHALV